MPLQLYSSDNLPVEEWTELTGNSFYSSPGFARIWRALGGREIFTVLREGNRLVAGMVGVLFGHFPFLRYQSMPDGITGCPYFAAGFGDEFKQEFYTGLGDWLRSRRVIRADIHNPPGDFRMKGFALGERYTHVIMLSDGVFHPTDPGIGKHIRTGQRRGAEVSLFTDASRLDDFYRLVKVTERRHNLKPRFPLELFRRLHRLSLDDSRILWLMVQYDNIMIGSRICLIEGTELLAWQFYSDKDYTHLKPGYLMFDYIFRHASEYGLKVINLGWSPPEVTSLIDYKERWGGEKQTFKYHTYFSCLGKFLYRWRPE
nr:GNAT family N-acetyltransferase [candidate division Zixibacteria bacterium]